MTPTSPPVAAWELGMRLREIRDRKELHRADVASALGITQNYLSNIEHGRRTIAEDKLHIIIGIYDIEDQRDELFALRGISNRRGWWSRYNTKLPTELVKLFSYLHGASALRSYEGSLVSGFLQTENYARAVHRGNGTLIAPSEVDTRVAARMRNQMRLFGDDPLPATIIMSEATLWHQVGGTAVLAGQLERLLDLIDDVPSLDLRIIPFAAGGYGALGGGTFHVLEFGGRRVRRLAWHETVTVTQLLDEDRKSVV